MTVLEPIKPVSTFVYKCDSRFHTDPLREMLDHDERYAFAIIDGNGGLFATIQGNSRQELYRFSASMPKKHRRGGQSSARFGRLREEARHNFVTKVTELLTKLFIDPETNLPNAKGLILAGNAQLKNQVFDSKGLDPRVKGMVIGVLDVAYGGNQGLNQAIELSEGALKGVTIVRHKKLFSQFFNEIAMDSGRFAFGNRDVFLALEQGAVDTLLVWENLSLIRHTLFNRETNSKEVIICSKDQQAITVAIAASSSSVTPNSFDLLESVSVVEYLVDNFGSFGVKLELVQDSTSEGSQFCKGFGGLGAILRYRLDFPSNDDDDEGEYQEDLDFI